MGLTETYLFLAVAVPIVLMWTGRVRPDVAGLLLGFLIALGQFCGLGLLGAAGDSEAAVLALSGLSQPVVITLFSLFVVTRSLERTGVPRSFARRVVSVGKSSHGRIIALLAANAAFLSLFMSNLAAGALVLSSAIEVSRRTGIKASKLLIPVAYGSCLGGIATYFTTTNIIASDMLRLANPPQEPLHILDFTPIGGLIALAGIAFLGFFGERFLPDREASDEQLVARRTGSELERAYQLNERQWELRVPRGASFIGQPLSLTGIGQRLGLTVLSVSRGKHTYFSPSPNERLQEGDRLTVVGREERVRQLVDEGLRLEEENDPKELSSRGATFSEVVLIPQSRAEGQSLRELNFRSRYGMTVVAIRREGRSYRTDLADMKLRQGDSILAMGGDERLRLLRASPDFLLIESDPSDQPTNWRQAAMIIAISLAAIVASILGVPVYLAMLGAAALVILSGLISMEAAYRGMEWQALLLIAGMYPLSLALVNTGIAQHFGEYVVRALEPLGALGLVAGAFLGTVAVAQLITGQVAILIAAPIFISAAIHAQVNPQAVAVATAIACSTCFLSPLSHPVNILMIGPGNYQFKDFFRAGWLLTILSFVTLLIGMKLFWGL